MKPILEIQDISKKFRIHHEHQPYLSMRDRISSLLKSNWAGDDEDFWALKNISFEVTQGESIGIIGKNGAGKSTLLKILSKITPPSSGKIISRGRIASLLEVGTGFHPELTGKENVFLNGSILGMKKKEIESKFDEIVDFSGVEKFLDTPLKHYSSGMQLRLAFAVAAFLEPEILVIDEVLAVGDADFQKKCLGKMNEVSKSGRTILFVSHNMNAVNTLCTRSIYLEKGKTAGIGLTENIITQYLNNYKKTNEQSWIDKNIGDDVARLLSARMVDDHGESIDFTSIDKITGIEMTFEILKNGCNPVPNIHIFTNMGEKAFVCSAEQTNLYSQRGIYKATMWIPGDLLNNGTYSAGIALSTMNPVIVHFYEHDALSFEAIEDIDKRHHEYRSAIPGVIRPKLNWSAIKI